MRDVDDEADEGQDIYSPLVPSTARRKPFRSQLLTSWRSDLGGFQKRVTFPKQGGPEKPKLSTYKLSKPLLAQDKQSQPTLHLTYYANSLRCFDLCYLFEYQQHS